MKTALCSPLRRAFVFLALSVVPAVAQTNFNSCGLRITSAGTYNATADMTASVNYQPCIEVTGLTGYSVVTLNGNSHTVTNASTNFTLYIHDNAPTSLVMYGGFIFKQTVQPGTPQTIIRLFNSSVYDTGNTIYDQVVWAYCNTGQAYSVTLQGSYYHNGAIVVTTCNGAGAYYNTFTDYNATSGSWITSAIYFNHVNAPKALNNNITGYAGAGGAYGIDDGILMDGPNDGTVLSNADIENNTCGQFYDQCYELTGAWSFVTLKNNSAVNASGFFGHFWYASMDHLDAENNSYCNFSGQPIYPFNIEMDTRSAYPTFWTNNTVKNNTSCSGYPSPSQFGYSAYHPNHFGTYTNNSFGGNTLGTVVYFDTAAGTVDLGANKCIAAYPAGALTCH